MRHRFESQHEQTGDLFEWQFIGQVNTKDPAYQKTLKETQQKEAKEGMTNNYIRFRSALALAKQFPAYDPTNPDKPFARDLRIALQDLLKLETPRDMDRIRFYTASGTPLDKLHGVDAFVEYEDEEGNILRATFDLTANPQKQGYKSDIIVQADTLPDPKLHEKEYLDKIEEYAENTLPKMLAKKLHEEKKVIIGPNVPH